MTAMQKIYLNISSNLSPARLTITDFEGNIVSCCDLTTNTTSGYFCSAKKDFVVALTPANGEAKPQRRILTVTKKQRKFCLNFEFLQPPTNAFLLTDKNYGLPIDGVLFFTQTTFNV